MNLADLCRMKNHCSGLAIFASGGGSNAEKIMSWFQNLPDVSVKVVVCNKPGAGVIALAQKRGIPVWEIDRAMFKEEDLFLNRLKEFEVDFIALAGFLWLVPSWLVKSYEGRIVNIHPALLPNYGGKGMHGHHVHEAVKAAGEKESGPTIHYVNEHYDEGDIIFQARTNILPEDSAGDIAAKVLRLEHEHYPRILYQLMSSTSKTSEK